MESWILHYLSFNNQYTVYNRASQLSMKEFNKCIGHDISLKCNSINSIVNYHKRLSLRDKKQ